MSQIPAFSKPLLDTARDHISALFQAFEQHTGLPRTYIGKLARGEPKFGTTFEDLDFRVGSYDVVISRLSAVWPDDLPWPAEVPRQAPTEIPDDLLSDYRRRTAHLAPPAQTATP
jgi:hypothetical protein